VTDDRLRELMDIVLRTPYPPECRGRAIDGVEMVLLDADIYGVATWYRDNDRNLTEAHRSMLADLLADLDRIWDQLPTDGALVFYGAVRDLGRYVMTTRGNSASN
jgi:hypothetical protein